MSAYVAARAAGRAAMALEYSAMSNELLECPSRAAAERDHLLRAGALQEQEVEIAPALPKGQTVEALLDRTRLRIGRTGEQNDAVVVPPEERALPERRAAHAVRVQRPWTDSA